MRVIPGERDLGGGKKKVLQGLRVAIQVFTSRDHKFSLLVYSAEVAL